MFEIFSEVSLSHSTDTRDFASSFMKPSYNCQLCSFVNYAEFAIKIHCVLRKEGEVVVS